MNEVFYITADMKGCQGYIEYCRFILGTGIEAAQDIFEQLLGLPDTGSEGMLRLSLVQPGSAPYEVLATKYCTLNELGNNCRLITRELFKYYNLDESMQR
jgi:hypothetical protein